MQLGEIVSEGASRFHAQFCLHKIKLYFQYFCNLNDSEKLVHENFLQQGCHPIVQTDGQSSALVQSVGWFCKGRGAKLSP